MLATNDKSYNIHLFSHGYTSTDVDKMNNDLTTKFSE
jgi:hypothetical protein